MRAVVVLCAALGLWLSAANVFAQDKLTFRQPEAGPMVHFITQVLEEAYADLGIQLEYRPLPRLRGEQLAAEGEIAGELGRLDNLSDTLSSLNQVPFKLFEFSVLLVANREQCGICTFERIDNLAYVSGMHSIEQVLKQRGFERPLFQQTELQQVAKLLSSGRIEAALLADFQLQSVALENPEDYVVYKMSEEAGYHYLHNDHASLIEPLHQKLMEMQISGRISQIRQQHNLLLPDALKPIEVPQRLVATSAIHSGLTNPDGSGKLWDQVRQLYGDITERISTSASNWPRAINMVLDERADIMVGVRKEQFSEQFVYSDDPVAMDDALYLFTNDSDQQAALLSGEDNHTVCFSGGDFQQDLLSSSFSYYRANTPLDCFAMLDLGRVDGVIDYQDNLPDWTEQPYRQHRLSDPVPLYLGFKNSSLGRTLKAHFQQQAAQLKAPLGNQAAATLHRQR